MDLIQESTDTLELDLIKAHLVISHNLDDVLLEHYKKASLEVVEEYLTTSLLDRIYESTSDEVVSDNQNTMLELECPYPPDKMIVYFSDGSQEDEHVTYDIGAKILYYYNINDLEVTKIEAFTFLKNSTAIEQVRLLLIGNWYEFRNADTALNLKQVPTGLLFMIDKLKKAEL